MTGQKRIHCTRGESVLFTGSRQFLNMKPTGLWYAFDRGWIDWCEQESFGDPGLPFEIKLNYPLRMCLIDTEKGLIEFNKKYRHKEQELLVHWDRVQRDYPGGIEIAPHFWDYRYDPEYLWYNTWDIPSGCLWGYGALNSVKPSMDIGHYDLDKYHKKLDSYVFGMKWTVTDLFGNHLGYYYTKKEAKQQHPGEDVVITKND